MIVESLKDLQAFNDSFVHTHNHGRAKLIRVLAKRDLAQSIRAIRVLT